MPGRHWQLVAFTVLTQLAVGLTVVLALVMKLGSGRFDQNDLDTIAGAFLPIVMIALVLAVGMATAHLGSPGAAFGVLANLRRSWLSREAAAGMVFGVLTAAAALAYRTEIGSPSGRWWLVIAAAAAGVVLIGAMARLYMLRTVPAWNTASTPVTFAAASAILGIASVPPVFGIASLSYGRSVGWITSGLLGDAELLDHLCDGLAPFLEEFGFAQSADDRFGGYRFLAMIRYACQLKI